MRKPLVRGQHTVNHMFHTTKTLPSEGLTTGIEPWLKLHADGEAFLSNVFPPTYSVGDEPLTFTISDHVCVFASHFEEKISELQ